MGCRRYWGYGAGYSGKSMRAKVTLLLSAGQGTGLICKPKRRNRLGPDQG